MDSSDLITLALQRVGELLAAEGKSARIVVVGGAAMNLLGYVSRATTDVDIIAFGTGATDEGERLIRPPRPLPHELVVAAKAVASAMNLRADWLNAGPEMQWDLGLPPGLESRLEWRQFAALAVGLVGRLDLIFLKLYAAADGIGPSSVHFQDLMALSPTVEELEAGRDWINLHSAGLTDTLEKVIKHATDAH